MSLLEPLAKSKVHCVYNGADLSQYEYRPSGEKPNGLPVILSVAGVIEKKGLGDLIRACQILRQRGSAFRLEIIGRGPLRRKLEARATELGMSGRVKFKAYVADSRPGATARLSFYKAALYLQEAKRDLGEQHHGWLERAEIMLDEGLPTLEQDNRGHQTCPN